MTVSPKHRLTPAGHLPRRSLPRVFERREAKSRRRTLLLPDVKVACGLEGESPLYADSPYLIVEVASPSTASIDRREKMLAYRRIPSLQSYLIFAQESPW